MGDAGWSACAFSDTGVPAVMVAGLVRISEVAERIMAGEAGRGVATATSGPCLQQNLVCVLEGEG